MKNYLNCILNFFIFIPVIMQFVLELLFIWRNYPFNDGKKFLPYIFSSSKKHRYHMVSPSPWPFVLSISLLLVILVFLNVINNHLSGYYLLVSIFILIACIWCWFRDINRESTYMGYHTMKVQTLLRTGFILFLVSEVMVFFGFFWAYFHVSLSPSIFIGNIWPPEGIVLHPFSEDILGSPVIFWGITIVDTFKPSIYHVADKCNIEKLSAVLSFIDDLHFSNYGFNKNYLVRSRENKKEQAIFMSTISYNDYLQDWDRRERWRHAYATTIPDRCPKPFMRVMQCFTNDVNVANLLEAWRFRNIKDFSNFTEEEINYYSNLLVEYKPQLDEVDNIFKFFSQWIKTLQQEDIEYALQQFSEDNGYIYCYINVYDSGALVNPFGIPLLNTLLLLTSGCTLMHSHACLRLRSYLRSLISLFITITLALFFIFCQFYEYTISAFSMIDGIYGSTFYMLTGLHGFHVIVGTIFLIVCFIRMYFMEISSNNHFSYEAAIWYWHFVDIVWIILYVFVYIWPAYFYFKNIHGTSIVCSDDDFFAHRYVFNSPVLFFKSLDSSLYNIDFSKYITDLNIKYEAFTYILNYFSSSDSAFTTDNYYDVPEDELLEFIDNDMSPILWQNSTAKLNYDIKDYIVIN